MVRESKLPEISLHQDNKKNLREELRLAQSGNIYIYPTTEGGVYNVKSLEFALKSIDYLRLQASNSNLCETDIKDALYIGNIPDDPCSEKDTSSSDIEKIIVSATDTIQIGDTANTNSSWASDGKITFESNEFQATIQKDLNIQAQTIDISSTNALNLTSNSLFLGKNPDTDPTESANFEIDAQNTTLRASNTFQVDASQIELNGPVKIYGTFEIPAASTLVYNGPLEVQNGAKIFVMGSSNDARQNGIYFDDAGEYAIYLVDETGYHPDGTSASITGKTLYLSIRDKFQIRNNADTLNFFTLENLSGDNVSPDILCSIAGNMSVQGNLTVGNTLTATSIFVQTEGVSTPTEIIDTNKNVKNISTLTATHLDTDTLHITDTFTAEKTLSLDTFRVLETILVKSNDPDDTHSLTLTPTKIEFAENTGTVTTNTLIADEISMVAPDASAQITELETQRLEVSNFDDINDPASILMENGSITLSDTLTTHTLYSTHVFGRNLQLSHSLQLVQPDDSSIIFAEINSQGTHITPALHANELTTNTLTTTSCLIFDTVQGHIRAKDVQVAGSVQAQQLLTDSVIIDANSVQALEGSITANEYKILKTDGTTISFVDPDGNMNVPGFVSIVGNIQTIGNMEVLGTSNVQTLNVNTQVEIKNDADDSLVLTPHAITFDAATSYWSRTELKVPELQVNTLDIANTLTLPKLDTNGTQIHCQNLTTPTLNLTTSTLVLPTPENVSHILENNIEFESLASYSGEIQIQTTEDDKPTLILEKDTQKTQILPESITLQSDTHTMNVTSNGFAITQSETVQTSLSDTEFTTPKITTQSLAVAQKITFGSTYQFVLDSNDKSTFTELLCELTDFPFDTTTGTPIVDKMYGPEYILTLDIFKYTGPSGTTQTKIASLIISLNFGSVFNQDNLYQVTGKLGDSYLNGSDSIKNIMTFTSDAASYKSSLYQADYERNQNQIRLFGDEISELGEISYSYTYSKSFGLGISE